VTTERPTTVAIVSLGCAKNLVDSEKLVAHLAEGGCVVGAPMDDADVIVVNTCGFLAAARDESLGVIAEAIEQKQSGRARRVVVAGCLATRDGKGLYKRLSGIDALVGVNNRRDILAAVAGSRRVTRVARQADGPADDTGRFRLTPPHTAYLRIAEGCARKCSFCTIPAIRGPLRSKTPEAVLAEARELVADGAVELNLIAQDTTSYGQDLGRGVSLTRLLRSLDDVAGLAWIRLMYAHPGRLTDPLIGALAECRRVVPYVDIPLQHICDRLLRRMRRAVTRRTIERTLDVLRRRVAGVAIRTTFIVGFPGESDDEFEQLLAFVKAQRFDALGLFTFSPEEGTDAAAMGPVVSGELAEARAEAIMLAQQEIAFAANRNRIGQPIEVLVDGADEDGRAWGRYYGQAPDVDSVCVLTAPAEQGRFVRGEVVDSDQYDLIVSAQDK